jgi:hypothetical protein
MPRRSRDLQAGFAGGAEDQETSAMTKVDLRRDLHPLYAAKRQPAFVDVPALSCLMVDGHGDPNTSPDYRAALSALYATSYAAKFALKRAAKLDYVVMPLEGLWWSSDMAAFDASHKSSWDWSIFIVQPDAVTPSVLGAAITTAIAKAPASALDRLHLERFAEGRAAQLLHFGPYSSEGPTIAALHDFIADHGCRMVGKHHEIYLGNPARSAPEKLKTIIRQPVAPR